VTLKAGFKVEDGGYNIFHYNRHIVILDFSKQAMLKKLKVERPKELSDEIVKNMVRVTLSQARKDIGCIVLSDFVKHLNMGEDLEISDGKLECKNFSMESENIIFTDSAPTIIGKEVFKIAKEFKANLINIQGIHTLTHMLYIQMVRGADMLTLLTTKGS